MAVFYRDPRVAPLARPQRFLLGALAPLLVLALVRGGQAMPETGIQSLSFTKGGCYEGEGGVVAMGVLTAYNRTTISLRFDCPEGKQFLEFAKVSWMLASYRCYNTLALVDGLQDKINLCPKLPEDETMLAPDVLSYTGFYPDIDAPLNCSLPFKFSMKTQEWKTITLPKTVAPSKTEAGETGEGGTAGSKVAEKNVSKTRSRRADASTTKLSPTAGLPFTGVSPTQGLPSNKTTVTPLTKTPGTSTAATVSPSPPVVDDGLLRIRSDGIYLLLLSIQLKDNGVNASTLTVSLTSKGPQGYLSAVDWPALPFYAVMFVLYALYLIIWLTLCCYYRKDILRVQYWIGAVILLGLLEKAVYLGEYNTLNNTGQSAVDGAIIFGELLSCFKRTLSRMLVVIVSVGFGIVRPRLGPTLHKILAMGALYYIVCAVEGCIRATSTKMEFGKKFFIPVIALAVLDAAICWWTMRTLRVRRNVVKLSLYRHFTNTLIFSVLASVAFMVWSLKQHKFQTCLQDWKELWVDEAFWHLLFSILIAVIMILWRPSANNQRYAYSPLLDAEDDEAEEPMINDAFDGIKLRQKSSENGTKSRHKENQSTEDDLRWIEENIPSSLADSALPSILDSEEELAATNYEISKTH